MRKEQREVNARHRLSHARWEREQSPSFRFAMAVMIVALAAVVML